jgi:hypothetical protein
LGGLTRIAEFKAIITEWDESGRVTFELEGINEPVTGSGCFLATTLASQADGIPHEPAPARQHGIFARIRDALARHLFDKIFGVKRDRDASSGTAVPNAEGEQTQITFNLTLTAGGMAGMAMNMLMAPMLKPVAEELATNIANAIQNG